VYGRRLCCLYGTKFYQLERIFAENCEDDDDVYLLPFGMVLSGYPQALWLLEGF